MSKDRIQTAAELVAKKALQSRMNPSQISEALKQAYLDLSEKEQTGPETAPEAAPVKAAPAKPPRTRVTVTRKKKATPEEPENQEELDRRFETLSYLRENPVRSVRADSVVCLECGGRFKVLTAKHLKTHGLDRERYREKWKLPEDQGLTSATYSKKRSEIISEVWARRESGETQEKEERDPYDFWVREPEPAQEFKPKVIRRKKAERK